MLSKTILMNMYTSMLRIRLAEESLVEPIVKGEVRCPVHLYSGEEAVAVGVAAHFKPGDSIFGTHRSHGHYLANGGGLKEMFSEIYGKAAGCSKGRGGSMHLCDPQRGFWGAAPIVAGTISLTLGAALGNSIKKNDNIAVCFFGDGATGEGVLYECLNFAALKKLPILFVCENNLYSTHLPISECRPGEEIYHIAEPFGIDSKRIDGNDIITVYETAGTMIENCRRGNGPAFLECLTYRRRGHVGPNDNIQGKGTDIRPKDEVKQWFKQDPLDIAKKLLLNNNISNTLELNKIEKTVKTEVKDALQFAVESPYPPESEVCEYVFK